MELCKKIFNNLDIQWLGNEEGIYRPAYSPQEEEAIKIIGVEASRLGMESYQDLAGNTYFILQGSDRYSPVFLTGSHVDAVPKGGKWDGIAGVVGALDAVSRITDKGLEPNVDIVVAILRSEESAWFGSALLGSKMACGQAGPEVLDYKRSDTQKKLRDYMQEIGLDNEALEEALCASRPLLPISRVGKFIEMHIEQGPTLISSDVELGFVTDIRGNVRFPDMISFFGRAAHTGGTPQIDRIDASLAAAYYQVELDKIFMEINKSQDIVWAFPQGGVVNGSSTTVCARYDIRPEVRTIDPHVIGLAKRAFSEVATKLEMERGISVGKNIENCAIQDPAPMNQALLVWMEKIAKSKGLKVMRTISGSGHDAASFSKTGIPTGLIFMPHGLNGLSHNPREIITHEPQQDPFSMLGYFNKAVSCMMDLMIENESSGERSSYTFSEHLEKHGARRLQF